MSQHVRNIRTSTVGRLQRRSGFLALTLATGLALFVLSPATASAIGSGSISGTVTDSSSDPVADSCVRAYDSGGDQAGFDWTDSNGDYTLGELGTGSFRVHFGACDQNVIEEYYDGRGGLEVATPVSVTDGSDTPGIDAQLEKGGSISGTVEGLPVAAESCFINIDAYDADGGLVGSDSSGAIEGGSFAYTIDDLGTGDYRLSFSESCLVFEPAFGWVSASEFYSNVGTLAAARPVTVTQGSARTHIDARLGQDPAPPDTLIDSGPSGTITNGEAAFEFSSSDPGPTTRFQCSIDSEPFADCSSPTTFSSLSNGSHTASFRAEDRYGNQDQTPATRAFKVDAPTPDVTARKATIRKVSVRGPVRLKQGLKTTHRVTISNSGNIDATGVALRVKGRGVNFRSSVGSIPAGGTRTIKARLRPRRSGKATLSYRVTSSNAGGTSVRRRVTVAK